MKEIFPRFLGMIMILSLGCQTLPLDKAKDGQEEGVQKLVQSFSANSQMKGKNVGVGEFVEGKGEVSSYSRGLADRFEVELSKAASRGQFQVINRQNFLQLAREWELNLSGAVDSSTAKKAGSLLGIDVLVTGSLSETREGMEISAKGLDTETGKVLWAEGARMKGERNIPSAAPKEPEPVREGEIKVRLWTDRVSHRIGETMTLYFQTDRDCYVTLIDVGTSGKVHVLYPNRFSGGSRVLAGKTYSVPGKEDGYAISVSGPPGIEMVRAIATLTPIPFIDSDFSKSPEIFKGIQAPAILTRDLNLVAVKTEPAGRGEGRIRIEIKE